jgi:hypothetical protein
MVSEMSENITNRRLSFSDAKLLLLKKRLRGKLSSSAPSPRVVTRRHDPTRACLSYTQQRILASAKREGHYSRYVRIVHLNGPLDVEALDQTFSEIVRRHESLRTVFIESGNQFLQFIQAPVTISLSTVDLSKLPEEKQDEEIQRRAGDEMYTPVDLTKGPVWHGMLLKLRERSHVLLFAMLHLVSDSTSVRILVRELTALYTAFSRWQPSPLTELPIQYGDFAEWERNWLQGDRLQSLVSFWRKQLQGCTWSTHLPVDRPRPNVPSFRGKDQSFTFATNLYSSLKDICRQEEVTPFMVMLAALNVLINLQTGQEDIVVNTGNANRTHSQTEGLIGPFNNVLMLRTKLTGAQSFRQLLQRVRVVALEAYAHQDLPFALVPLEPPFDVDTNSPFTQIGLTLHHYAEQKTAAPATPLTGNELQVDISGVGGRSALDLSFSVVDNDETFGGTVEYNCDLFDDATVSRIVQQYQAILERVCDNVDLPLSDFRASV